MAVVECTAKIASVQAPLDAAPAGVAFVERDVCSSVARVVWAGFELDKQLRMLRGPGKSSNKNIDGLGTLPAKGVALVPVEPGARTNLQVCSKSACTQDLPVGAIVGVEDPALEGIARERNNTAFAELVWAGIPDDEIKVLRRRVVARLASRAAANQWGFHRDR